MAEVQGRLRKGQIVALQIDVYADLHISGFFRLLRDIEGTEWTAIRDRFPRVRPDWSESTVLEDAFFDELTRLKIVERTEDVIEMWADDDLPKGGCDG